MKGNGGRDNADIATDPTFKISLRNAWVKSVYGSGVVIGSSSFTRETGK